ncbi:MAG TPA: thioredoxin family protein [Kofleriaceae bacterium]|nr:thioredoxin family protein [Kofleriaceae bacterium]
MVRLALALALCVACNQAAAPPAPGHVDLIDAPAGTKDVAALVRDTAQRLAAQHRRLVVYVGATWCEPCRQIHDAIIAHRLDTTFPDLSLLVFDLDRDGDALAQAGYQSELIPLFALPGPDGRATKMASGGKKGIDNVGLLTEKLRQLLSA